MKPQKLPQQVPDSDSDSDLDLKRYASQRKAFHRGKADIRRFKTGKDDNLLTTTPALPLSPRPDIKPHGNVKVVPVPVPIPVPVPLSTTHKGIASTPSGLSRIKILDALDPHLHHAHLKQTGLRHRDRDRTKTSTKGNVWKPAVERVSSLVEEDYPRRSLKQYRTQHPPPHARAHARSQSRELRAHVANDHSAEASPSASSHTTHAQSPGIQSQSGTAEEKRLRRERRRERRQQELHAVVAEALAHYYPHGYGAPYAPRLAGKLAHMHAHAASLQQPALMHAASAPVGAASLFARGAPGLAATAGAPRSTSGDADGWALPWPQQHLAALTPLSYSYQHPYTYPYPYSPTAPGAFTPLPTHRARKPRFRLSAYCTCEAYDLVVLRKAAKAERARLSQRQARAGDTRDGAGAGSTSRGGAPNDALAWEGLPMEGQVRVLSEEVVMFVATPLFLSKTMFVFEHGCVCFFNFARAEESAWLLWLRALERDPIDTRDRAVAVETLRYSYWEPRVRPPSDETERDGGGASVAAEGWGSGSSSGDDNSSCPSERGSPHREEDDGNSAEESAASQSPRSSGSEGGDDRDIADMGVTDPYDEGPGEMETLLTADRDEPEEASTVDGMGKEEEPRFTARHNVLTLAGRDPLEKLACAFALSQAVKLNVFEKNVERVIAEHTMVATSLKRDGNLKMSKMEMSRRMGAIFLAKSNIDLQCSVLDTPSFFWDDGLKFKRVYDTCFDFLEVPRRVDLLRDRLSMLTELFNILHHQMSQTHVTRLNWIIILFIILSRGYKLVYDVFVRDIASLLF